MLNNKRQARYLRLWRRRSLRRRVKRLIQLGKRMGLTPGITRQCYQRKLQVRMDRFARQYEENRQ